METDTVLLRIFVFCKGCVESEENSEAMGVTVEILKEGTSSRKPQAKEVVHCHYVGTLLDGTVFDSSVSRAKPLTFMIGIGSVIKCWDEVCQGHSVSAKH